MDITKLKGQVPDLIYNQLPRVVNTYQINTVKRMAHFLAQCGHESGGFRVLEESLNYSDPNRIWDIFKRFDKDKDRRPDPEEIEFCKTFVRKPEKLANYVYSNRMGNRDEASGDGWRFRGRGCIQLTGRDNYTRYDKVCPENVLSNPDLLKGSLALDSAGWFWFSNGLNSLADTGTVAQITRRVNGGTHGLADREKRYNALISILS